MKFYLNRNTALAGIALSGVLLVSCDDTSMPAIGDNDNTITATIAPTRESRTCIEGDPATTGSADILWTPGDALGVFASATSAQVQYIKKNQYSNESEAEFVAYSSAEAVAAPAYAYYPYSDDNSNRTPDDLLGRIPAYQKISGGNIDGDYKIGMPDGTGNLAFAHLFSLVRVAIDTEGTPGLEGDVVEQANLTVSRDAAPVAITGDFNFDATAVEPNYTLGSATDNCLEMGWEGNEAGSEVGYASVFPEIKTGDLLEFEVITDRHVATFSVNSKVDFESGRLYNFPLKLSEIKDKDGNPVKITITVRPGVSESRTGTFTCATYNVDGLPSIVNSGGPGSSGTTQIGKSIAADNWDFFGVSENFDYNDKLWAEISGIFNQGTYRKATLGVGTADTDGLNFYWRKNGVEAGGETIVEYTSKYGGLTDGANTSVKKGFRHYEVSLSEDVIIDVYITHMNTYSSKGTGHINAQHAQLEQLRDYVIAKAKANKRPAIIMGDTNLRYTRHKIKELLIDKVNEPENAMEIVDPWVSLAWGYDFSSVGGDEYPLYGGKSLMVSDATGTDASTDVIISEDDGGLQKGEVVDKIFYINCKDANTQIAAKSYLRDVSYKKSDGSALADHYPVVVEFEYTTK